MRVLLIIVVIASAWSNDVTRIAEINRMKKEAREAYTEGDYAKAINVYQYLLDSMEVKDENIMLNLSNAYFNLSDSVNARKYYSQLTSSDEASIRSRAYQQLGVMDFSAQNHKQALQNFKQSLKAMPTNDESRYNYELLKKILQEQEQQQEEEEQEQEQENQDQQNQDQQHQNEDQQQDQENQEQQDQEQQQDQEGEQENEDQQQEQENQEEQEGEQEQSEQEQEGEENEDQNPMTNPEQLEELNISEEKAKMILEAMKNNEIQYIQQNRRKAQEPRKSGKPDW